MRSVKGSRPTAVQRQALVGRGWPHVRPLGMLLVWGLACGRTELLFVAANHDDAGPFGSGGSMGGGSGLDDGGRAGGVGGSRGGTRGGAGDNSSGGGARAGAGGAGGIAEGGRGGSPDGGNPCELSGANCGPRITRVSLSSTGGQGDGISTYSRISGDASRIVFVSRADNFFPKASPGSLELVVHERRSKTTTRACNATGAFAIPPALSTDGALVGFTLPDATTGTENAVLCELPKGAERVLVAKGGEPAHSPQLSPDGRFAGFETLTSSSGWRVVVRNLATLEEATFPEARLPWGFTALSADANQILLSTAKGLVRWDRPANTETVIAEGQEGDINFPAISGDGRFVAFNSLGAHVPEDTNGLEDIYLYDAATRRIQRISAGPTGANSDGRSLSPCISYDGRFVVYASDASNLVGGDTNGARDIFVFDRAERNTRRVNVAHDGAQGNANCHFPSISDDGRVVAFSCEADNMVPNDTNAVIDVFVVER